MRTKLRRKTEYITRLLQGRHPGADIRMKVDNDHDSVTFSLRTNVDGQQHVVEYTAGFETIAIALSDVFACNVSDIFVAQCEESQYKRCKTCQERVIHGVTLCKSCRFIARNHDALPCIRCMGSTKPDTTTLYCHSCKLEQAHQCSTNQNSTAG